MSNEVLQAPVLDPELPIELAMEDDIMRQVETAREVGIQPGSHEAKAARYLSHLSQGLSVSDTGEHHLTVTYNDGDKTTFDVSEDFAHRLATFKPVRAPRASFKLGREDLMTIGKDGRARRPDGSHKFLSNEDVENIMAHEQQISYGLKGWLAENGLVTIDTQNRARNVETGKRLTNAQLIHLSNTADFSREAREARMLQDEIVVEQPEITPIVEVVEPEAEIINPVVEPTPLNWRDRVKYLGQRIKELPAATFVWAETTVNRIQTADPRRRTAGLTAGALVAAVAVGAYYLANKHGGGDVSAYMPPVTGEKLNQNQEVINALGGVSTKGMQVHEHSQAVVDALSNTPTPADLTASTPEVTQHVVHLQHGGTVWGVAQENLARKTHHEPSNYQVYLETRRLLHLNHISWLQARHLGVGTELKLN